MTKILLGEVLQLALNKEVIDSSKVYEMAGVLSFGKGLFKRDKIENGSTSYKYFLRLSAEHIVMSQLFGWEGALALSSPDFEDCYVSPQFPTFLCDESRLNRKFLGWLMRQPSFWADLGSRAKGMGDRRRTLNPEALFACKIPLPPLAEQQAIATHLDAIADKVRQVNEHLDAIEANADAMTLSLHHRLARGREVHLKDIIELFGDLAPISPDGVYPQVGVRSFGGGLFTKAAITGTETSYKVFNRLYSDAVVLSQLKGWEGALAVCPPHMAGMFVSPEYRTFRCIPNKASSVYLAELIKTPWFWSLLQAATRGVGARRERTRPEQFLNVKLPMPTYEDQLKAVKILSRQSTLKQQHTAIREANAALVPAMLERLFSRQAAFSTNSVVSLPIRTKTDSSVPKNFFYRRAAVDTYIVHALADDPHLGRTKLEKISHLIEYHCRFNLNRQPVRDAYGPNDYPSRRKVEGFAGKQNWYACVDASNRAGVTYVPGEKIADALPIAEDALGDRKPAVDDLIELLRPLDTKQCEIIATLYAAWNDLLLRGEHPSDKTLLLEATERWHPNKLSIPASRWHKGIEWLRANEIIPIGQGRPVLEKKETSQ